MYKRQIIDSAKIACAYDFINRLPNGLDTVVGENGKGLSEGQIPVSYTHLDVYKRQASLAAGETFTVTVTPDNGYVLNAITVTRCV